MSEISLSSAIIFSAGPIPITNAMLATFLITIGLCIFAVFIKYSAAIVPGRIQVLLETLMEFMMRQLEEAFGTRERAEKFFPLLVTVLIFIIIANQLTLVPFIGQIVAGEKNLFRLPTSDLSLPLTLALIVVGLANILALSISPLKHIGNFIRIAPFFHIKSFGDFGAALLGFFLGILDTISEVAKIASLSGRLFGNMFAGEVMVIVIVGLSAFTQFIAPIPFIILSMFSGLVQAFVFTLLSIQFIAGTINSVAEKPSTASP
ncbi:MAG: FoF1 ATP synthase subunit a [bacterium]|nr:FoF1 ATP synthase subunit a [bacterium]